MSGRLDGSPVPIFLYHSVSDRASPRYSRWNTTPAQFADHLDWILDRFTPIPLRTLVAAIQNDTAVPDRAAVVTFDDGLADFAEGAVPVLTDRNVPTTLFVTTSYVGCTSEWLRPLGEGRRPMLSWVQLRELIAEGVTIGSHGRTHRPLDELTADEVVAEIATSRAELEQELQVPIDLFAYPHGYHSPAVKRALTRSGYTASCAVRNALSSTHDDVLALSRIMIEQPCSVGDLERLFDAGRLRTAPFPEQLRTKMWRRFRRVRARVARTAQP